MLISITILLIGSIMLGTSYSIWTTTVYQEGENVVNVGCFKITYTDSGFDDAGTIDLSNEYPITDAAGANKQPYKFTIKNECSIDAEYYVNLETLNTSTMNLNYLKVMFNDNTPVIYNDGLETVSPYLVDDATTARLLTSGYLANGEEVTYSLRLWIDYSAETTTSNVMGTSYVGKVTVYSKATASTSPKYEYQGDGESLSSFIASTDLDEYLVGANANNYVRFNDELWRINSNGDFVSLTKAKPLTDYTFDYENLSNYSTSPFIKISEVDGVETIINYYDTFSDDAKNMMVETDKIFGQITNVDTDIYHLEYSSSSNWSGKVFLPTIKEYIVSNSSSDCHNSSLSDIISNKICINTTYLNTWGNTYLMNYGLNDIYIVTQNGIKEKTTEENISIIPQVYVDYHTFVVSGDGSYSNPYILEYNAEAQEPEKEIIY